MSTKTKGLLLAAITAVMWGILAIGLKIATQFISVWPIVWIRFVVAALGVFLYFIIYSPLELKKLWPIPPLGIVAGLALGVNYYGFMQGIALTSPSNAQILIQLGPLLMIWVGTFLFKEKIRPVQIFGFVLALSGLYFFYQDQINQLFSSADYQKGNIWVVVAAVGWAIYISIQKWLLQVKRYSPVQLSFLVYLICLVIFTPIIPYHEFLNLNFSQWTLMLLLGLNTLIAYGCLGEAIKYIPSNQIGIIITLNPLLTIFLMALLTQFQLKWVPTEFISIKGYFAAILVIIGAIIVVGKKSTKV